MSARRNIFSHRYHFDLLRNFCLYLVRLSSPMMVVLQQTKREQMTGPTFRGFCGPLHILTAMRIVRQLKALSGP